MDLYDDIGLDVDVKLSYNRKIMLIHVKRIVFIWKQALGFCNSDNIIVTGLTSLNSQMFHIVIYECRNVKVHGVKVVAPENSPNTDGIHVQLSSDVTIIKPKIRTGDDCISIGPGSRNLWIEDVVCGPGHGIRLLFNLKFTSSKLI
jgi:polygalacturonase